LPVSLNNGAEIVELLANLAGADANNVLDDSPGSFGLEGPGLGRAKSVWDVDFRLTSAAGFLKVKMNS
jgi:hypothetical protein